MRKSRETDIDKILKVTDEEVLELKKDFGWLIDNFQKEEDEDFEKAKQEVEEIFSKYIKDFDQISTATVQRKLHIGYAKAAKFIDILAIKVIAKIKTISDVIICDVVAVPSIILNGILNGDDIGSIDANIFILLLGFIIAKYAK